MRVIKYFKGHGVAVFLVVILLIAQACCDLALPNYTSQLVDVGIQQSGIQNASTTVMTQDTYQTIFDTLDSSDSAVFAQAYEKDSDDLYHLTTYGEDNRSTIDGLVSEPLITKYLGMTSDMLATQNESTIEQEAVAAAAVEYTNAGIDTSSIQISYLLQTGLIMMGFVALSVIVASLIGLLASRTGASIGRDLRSRLFAKVVSFSDAEMQQFSAASLITRGTNDIQQIQQMSIMLLRMVLYSPILAIGGIIMVARTDLSMGWIIAVGIGAVMLVIAVLFKVAMPKFKIMQKLIDRVNLVAREMLTGVSVVRAFGRQATEQERFDAASTDLMATQLFVNRVMTFMMPAMMLIMNGISVLIVWIGAGAIDAGNMQTGDMIAFITYSMVIIMSFLILGMLAIIIPRAEISAQRIDEILETEPSIVDSVSPIAPVSETSDQTQSQSEQAVGAELAFNHVDFKYGDSNENVLDNIDFVAEAGKTTAIIGSTGCGKSTILKLAERFYDVTGGAITLDGVDIRNITQHDLRSQLGYVPQRAFLFSGTIASNVGYGTSDPAGAAGKARIDTALDVAQASEFVDNLPDGINATITQGGTNVSGGQRQRLAIARALATDARAYLFDDSFSALDYKTDAALRRALLTQMKGKTVVIVAQRIATVLHADKIIVLDDGRIVGQGTHEELMDSCETYREIAFSQLSEKELRGGDAA